MYTHTHVHTRAHTHTHTLLLIRLICVTLLELFNYILITNSSLSIKFLIKSEEFLLLSP